MMPSPHEIRLDDANRIWTDMRARIASPENYQTWEQLVRDLKLHPVNARNELSNQEGNLTNWANIVPIIVKDDGKNTGILSCQLPVLKKLKGVPTNERVEYIVEKTGSMGKESSLYAHVPFHEIQKEAIRYITTIIGEGMERAWKYQNQVSSSELLSCEGPYFSAKYATDIALGLPVQSADPIRSVRFIPNQFEQNDVYVSEAIKRATEALYSRRLLDVELKEKLVSVIHLKMSGDTTTLFQHKLGVPGTTPGPVKLLNQVGLRDGKARALGDLYDKNAVYILFLEHLTLAVKWKVSDKDREPYIETLRLKYIQSDVEKYVQRESSPIMDIYPEEASLTPSSSSIVRWREFLMTQVVKTEQRRYEFEEFIESQEDQKAINRTRTELKWNIMKAEYDILATQLLRGKWKLLVQVLRVLSARLALRENSREEEEDRPICVCGYPKNVCNGAGPRITQPPVLPRGDTTSPPNSGESQVVESTRNWPAENFEPQDPLGMLQKLHSLFQTVGDFPDISDLSINDTVKSAYLNGPGSDEYVLLTALAGDKCSGLSPETKRAIDEIHNTILLETKQARENLSSRAATKLGSSATAAVSAGAADLLFADFSTLDMDKYKYNWPAEIGPSTVRSLIDQFGRNPDDLKDVSDGTYKAIIMDILEKRNVIQGLRIRALSQYQRLPGPFEVEEFCRDLKAKLKVLPGTREGTTRYFLGYEHDETKLRAWKAAHAEVELLKSLQDSLHFLAHNGHVFAYSGGEKEEFLKMARSICIDEHSDIPLQTQRGFVHFLQMYGLAIQKSYLSQCTNAENDAKRPGSCSYRAENDQEALVNLAQYVFYYLQMIMSKALVMMRPGLGKTLALVKCLMDRYYRTDAPAGSKGQSYLAKRHIVVLPSRKLLADFCLVLSQQLTSASKSMRVIRLSYIISQRSDGGKENQLLAREHLLPASVNYSHGNERVQKGVDPAPMLLITLGDLLVLTRMRRVQGANMDYFRSLGLAPFFRYMPGQNSCALETEHTCVYFDEIHDLYSDELGPDALFRLEKRCGAKGEAEGMSLEVEDLAYARDVLSAVPQLIGFSGTPYQFEDARVGAAGGVTRYNRMFNFPTMHHYLLVGLYTPPADLAVMNLRMFSTELTDIAFSYAYNLDRDTVATLKRDASDDEQLRVACDAYLDNKSVHNMTRVQLLPDSEPILAWMQRRFDSYRMQRIIEQILWGASTTSRRRALPFNGNLPKAPTEVDAEIPPPQPFYYRVWKRLQLANGLRSTQNRTVVMFTESDIGYELMALCVEQKVPFIAIALDETRGKNITYAAEGGVTYITADPGNKEHPAYKLGLDMFNRGCSVSRKRAGDVDAAVLFYNTIGLEQGEDIEAVSTLALLSLASSALTQLQCILRVNRFGKVVKRDGMAPSIEVVMFPTPFNRPMFCHMIHVLAYYSEMVREGARLGADTAETAMFLVDTELKCSKENTGKSEKSADSA